MPTALANSSMKLTIMSVREEPLSDILLPTTSSAVAIGWPLTNTAATAKAPNSSAFYPTTSSLVWQLETPVHNTDDLLTALNLGAEQIEAEFPDLGEVSRWHEDYGMENGGFPVFGIYDVLNELPSTLSATVYPNPAKEKVTVDGIEASEIQVYNALGQLVKTVRNANEIDVEGLPQGVYLLRIADAEGKVFTAKVAVRR
jgi:hypothetical protein